MNELRNYCLKLRNLITFILEVLNITEKNQRSLYEGKFLGDIRRTGSVYEALFIRNGCRTVWVSAIDN